MSSTGMWHSLSHLLCTADLRRTGVRCYGPTFPVTHRLREGRTETLQSTEGRFATVKKYPRNKQLCTCDHGSKTTSKITPKRTPSCRPIYSHHPQPLKKKTPICTTTYTVKSVFPTQFNTIANLKLYLKKGETRTLRVTRITTF